MVSIVTLFLTAWVTGSSQDAAKSLSELSSKVKELWPLSVALLFFAYMVGNILRAVPVGAVDQICGWLFRRTARNDFDRALYQASFPYLPMLEKQFGALQINGVVGERCLPPEGTAHTAFNLWKLLLCHRSVAAFEYASELEGRVRLFSGMIWTALLSGALGFVGVLWSLPGHRFHPSWLWIMVGIVIVSVVFALLLGWRLRRVRSEEVLAVFLGVISLSQKTNP